MVYRAGEMPVAAAPRACPVNGRITPALPAPSTSWAKRLLILPPLLVGVAIVAFAVRTRAPPEQAPPVERATAVRAIAVPKVTVVPRALGYGVARPEKEWKAVAQVSGKVVALHPGLRKGQILPAGTVLLRLDPIDYELKVREVEASIASAEAELAELAVRADNLRRSGAIGRRALDLSRRELERRRQLYERGTAAAAAVDEVEQTMLASRQKVQDIDNELNLVPARRKVLEAKLALYRAQLDDARLDSARTTVAAPFDVRISAVAVEQDQFARAGDVMAEADGIDVAEVEAQVPIDRLLPLVPPGLDPSGWSAAEFADAPRQLGLKAVVRLRTGALAPEWPARVARVSPTVDPQTRTVGVIVAVDEPYRKIVPGRRPPLVRGMYVEVELSGQGKPGRLVVPRTALHAHGDGVAAYVVDSERRLQRRPLRIGIEQPDFVTVDEGLAAGEWIVISDPMPAIDGMLLEVVEDAAAAVRLGAAASGGAEAP